MRTLKNLIKKIKEYNKTPFKKMIAFLNGIQLPAFYTFFLQKERQKGRKSSPSPWGKVGMGILLFLFSLNTYAQLEAANWYFGDQAGLDFNSGTPVALTDGQLVQQEGCATISDENGNLLFYTNGIDIYNANHNIMLNGTGLLGDDSSTQSAIIVPDPGDDDQYYVFAVDYQGGSDGLTYSVVDMTLDGGLGAVISTEKNIQLETPVAEKLTAVYHDNGTDIWVIAHRMDSNDFVSYLVTNNGVNNTPIISNSGLVYISAGIGSGAIGYLKASPDGTKLASATPFFNTGLELFDFDNSSGLVSNAQLLNTNANYGVEFSPNSKVLYCTLSSAGTGPLIQYDITQPTLADIQASETVIATASEYSAIQLAIDGKLYTTNHLNPYLSVINNPNELGTACNFVDDAVDLAGNNSRLGLPPFITSYFQFEIAYEDLCSGSPTQFEVETRSDLAVTDWNFGDPDSGSANTSAEEMPSHTYESPGTYTVTVDLETSIGYEITLTEEITILASPEANPVEDLELCDELPNEGQAVFDLSQQSPEILGDQESGTHSVSYYTAMEEAEEGLNPIGNPAAYSNTENPQTIYARVDHAENECYVITSFDLRVYASPFLEALDLEPECTNTPVESIDLTSYQDALINGQHLNTFSLTYHSSQSDADEGEDALSNLSAYPIENNSCTSFYVRLENTEYPDCYVTSSFDYCSYATAIAATQDLEECDSDSNGSAIFDLTVNDTGVLGADQPASDYSVSYYEDEASAEAGTPSIGTPSSYENTSSPQTIWVRVESNTLTSCYAVDSFTITSYESGIANPVPDLSYCDTDTNGDAVYDLTQNTPILLGAQDANDFTVSYYETIAEANVPTNAIADPANYTAGSNSQTIYVRIENTINGDCYNLTDFTLETTPVTVGVVSDKYACDGGTTGTASFDLTDSDNEALSGQSPQDYTLSYYASQTDLDNDNAIATPTAYENTSNPQEIFVRVSADAIADCTASTSFMIETVPSAPIGSPTPLVACDTDNDGIYTEFNLESKVDEISLGNPDLEISFHLTASDALSGASPQSSPFTNTSFYQDVVYVRAEDQVSGCVITTELVLEVYDRPVISTPAGLSQCDDDADGFAIFDLTQVEPEVLDGQDPAPFSITYHQEEQEAEDGVNAITNPGGYENETNPESIWIRVTDTTTPTGCYRVVELILAVNPLPVINQPEPLAVCDDLASGSDTDELSVFDLTSKEEEITGGESSYSVKWYATDSFGEVGPATLIMSPGSYANAGNEENVIAEVINQYDCSRLITLTLVVNPLPSPTPTSELDPYIVCDDDNDGFSEFDLSTQDDLIANGEANVTITYYATADDAAEGFSQDELPNLYGNTQGFTQTIFARSTNINTGCYRVVELTLEVRSLPDFAAELEDLFSCDGDDGDSTAIFDLTENESTIYGDVDPSLYTLSYYTSEADALTSTDPIGVPTAYSNQGVSPLTVWVRYANVDSGCVRIGSFELRVGESPAITNPSPLSACDDSAGAIDDEVGLFDLTSKTPEITGGDNSLSVSYYESQADLDNDQAIASADAYENISNEQTVQVKVSNASGCESFTSLTLVVTPNPSIAEELAALEVCDIDNDGFEEFDLESYKSVILDGEPNVSVSYHLTEDAADLGVNPIDTSAPYGTSNLAQTIWVRVTNTGPNGDDGTGCYVVRSLELIV
ncbi:PKD domain-containing protein, partial [Mesonia aquimarina]|uniref:PKD domain-containing protein n=1 Tax=Mesonia aquimarina TaxID=1504967 RepID=UPI000EF5BCEF